MHSPYVHRTKVEKAMLYRVVFELSAVKFAVGMLFIFFLLHPTMPAFAAEEGVATEVEAVEEVELTQEVTAHEDVEATEDQEVATEDDEVTEVQVSQEVIDDPVSMQADFVTEDINLNEEVIGQVFEEDLVVVDYEDQQLIATPEVVSQEASEAEVEVSDSVVSGSTPESEDDQMQDSAVSASLPEVVTAGEPEEGQELSPEDQAEEVIVAEPEELEDAQRETDAESSEPAATTEDTVSSSTINSVDVVYKQTALVDDSNRYQFSTKECVTVGDGSYYCNKTNVTGASNEHQVVFSAPDGDGDQEIFFNTGKKIVQVTQNLYDDDAPEYDAVSHTIVWHRLVAGRYQIVSYDITDETETVLTDTATNNMEPSKEGVVTVWQRWVADNWEIVLHDGTEETILTQSKVHDVAPDIQGGYVIWHTTDTAGEKQVAVYEIATGLLSYIADADGGQVVNPRFVLVYDTKFENGDSITKGYDPETGTLIPLSSQPGEEPVSIPSSDSTGETRALISTKTNGREDSLEELVLKPLASSTDAVSPVATSSSDILMESASQAATTTVAEVADEGILDLSTTTPVVSENLPLTDFDIIVEPYEATSTQSIDSVSTQEIVE